MAQNTRPAGLPDSQTTLRHSTYGNANTAIAYTFDENGGPERLAWQGDLAGAVAFRRRVTRQTTMNDSTIKSVQGNREQFIYRMFQAVYSTNTAGDNPNFEGMAWFTFGGNNMVSPYEVEALCRVLFQAVIDRCEGGYRGMERSDRLRKGQIEKVDITGNCKTRIENVIDALRQWKSICKDILLSDSQIANFANAPASIALDKQKYRSNNITKKNTTQKERELGVTAVHGSETAEELKAKGDLPPLARLGHQTKRRGRLSEEGTKPSEVPSQAQHLRQSQISFEESQMGSKIRLQPQSQAGSVSSKTRGSEPSDLGLLDDMSATQLREFDVLSQDIFPGMRSAAPSDPIRYHPAYEYSDFGSIPQQNQPYVIYQEQLSIPHQQPSEPQDQPAYNTYGVGVMQHMRQQSGGYYQGMPPVSFSNHFNGPTYTPTFPVSTQYGDNTSHVGNHSTYGTVVEPKTAGSFYAGTTVDITSHDSSAQANQTETSRPLNPAAKQFKHSRTTTMDAEYQPEPSRVRLDKTQDESPQMQTTFTSE